MKKREEIKAIEQLMGIPAERIKVFAVVYAIFIVALIITAWLQPRTDCRPLMTVTLVGILLIMNIEPFLFMKPGFGNYTFDNLLDYYPADVSGFILHMLRNSLAEGAAAYVIATLLLLVTAKTTDSIYILLMNLRAPGIVLISWMMSRWSMWLGEKKKDISGNTFLGGALTIQIALVLLLLVSRFFQ